MSDQKMNDAAAGLEALAKHAQAGEKPADTVARLAGRVELTPELYLGAKLAVRRDLDNFMRQNPSLNVQESVIHVFAAYQRELDATRAPVEAG